MCRKLLIIGAAVIVSSAAGIYCRTVAARPERRGREEHQRDAAAVRAELLQRLRRLADHRQSLFARDYRFDFGPQFQCNDH